MNVPNFGIPKNPFEGAQAIFEATRKNTNILVAGFIALVCLAGMYLLWWLFDMPSLMTLAFGIVVIPTAFVVLGFAATVAGIFAGKQGIQKLLTDIQVAVAEKKAAAA